MKIVKNINLAPYTTFGIGGPADYFYEAKNSEQIIQAIRWAKSKKLPYFVLGGGSNLLVADEGVRGLVIKVKSQKSKVKSQKDKHIIIADAGVKVNRLVDETIKRELGGLEYFAGLPGTVGGAIYNNSHWQNHFFSDNLRQVEVLDRSLKRKVFSRKEIDFDYDYSRFQKSGEIILGTTFALKRVNKEVLEQRVKEVLERRMEQPKGKSAGCIFKNPEGINAGYLIQKAGLRGKSIGKIKISQDHANFFINTGGGRAREVIQLIKLVQKKVKEKFGVKLEPEIFFLGISTSEVEDSRNKRDFIGRVKRVRPYPAARSDPKQNFFVFSPRGWKKGESSCLKS